jgi:FdhE protein
VPQGRAAITLLSEYDAHKIETLADGFLQGNIAAADAGVAVYVAAALQVYFTRMAASLLASSLRLLPERGMCPCCGSTPIAGLIAASGRTQGARYLYCSLCSAAWNHVRAVCITCGGSRVLSLRSIEEDTGTAKAETCGDCRTYSKVLYQAKDIIVDPFADDISTLGLDFLLAEACWSRHAPNPLILVGKSWQEALEVRCRDAHRPRATIAPAAGDDQRKSAPSCAMPPKPCLRSVSRLTTRYNGNG